MQNYILRNKKLITIPTGVIKIDLRELSLNLVYPKNRKKIELKI
jgi:hypothetical protein